MIQRKILATVICAMVIASSIGYYYLGEKLFPGQPTSRQLIRIELNATASLDELPFEVRWSAIVSGGVPPYLVESPSGVAKLMDSGRVSGIQLFKTNKNPWEITFKVKDALGQDAIARTYVDNTILVGTTLTLNGAKLSDDSMRFVWEQVHNPDRYDGSEYVTGNEAEIETDSPNPTVTFQWPGLYRLSLRAVRPDGAEVLHTVDALVSLSESPFKLRGAALPLNNQGQLLESNLDRVVAWGGNLVAFHFNLYVPQPNSNVIVPSWRLNETCPNRPPTPNDDQLESWIRLAHRRGLSVLLVPHVVYIAAITGSSYNRTTWVEMWQFEPQDKAAWFRNYQQWILHYATIAEGTGVEIFSVGVDLGPFEYVPNVWRQVILEARKIYHGKVTVTEAPGWGAQGGYGLPQWHPEPPDFLQDIDLMDFDFNYRGSDVFHPTVTEMAKNFSGYIRGEGNQFVQGNQYAAVPYMKKYGKPWLVNALGLPNGDGVNRYLHPHGERPDEGPLRIDNQEQVDYVEAGFRALSELSESEVGDLLLGVVIWSLDDWHTPPDFADPPQWTVAGRPVEEAIQLWFCGKGELPLYGETNASLISAKLDLSMVGTPRVPMEIGTIGQRHVKSHRAVNWNSNRMTPDQHSL